MQQTEVNLFKKFWILM